MTSSENFTRLPPGLKIFCNRSINFKNIQAVGFDMDYTLAVYIPETFEALAYTETTKKLVKQGYPQEILSWTFDPNYMIRGLAIDKVRGNIIKMDRHRYVKVAYHGFKEIDRDTRREIYDVSKILSYDEPLFSMVDTQFSLAEAYLYSQIIELKSQKPDSIQRTFHDIFNDIRHAIDLSHRDGTIKKKVAEKPNVYIRKDERIQKLISHLKQSGMKTFITTNSLWDYTNVVMSFLLGPDWTNSFDLVVTGAQKPKFFTSNESIYAVDTKTGLLRTIDFIDTIDSKVFHGGNYQQLHSLLEIKSGSRILYAGDHIYGDILRSKKNLGWRTMLIVEELEREIDTSITHKADHQEYENLIQIKDYLELECQSLELQVKSGEIRKENLQFAGKKIDLLREEISATKTKISQILKDYHEKFHPVWGELMKAGYQNSRFAAQVESYACLYTSRITNLLYYPTNKTFHSTRDFMPHDFLS